MPKAGTTTSNERFKLSKLIHGAVKVDPWRFDLPGLGHTKNSNFRRVFADASIRASWTYHETIQHTHTCEPELFFQKQPIFFKQFHDSNRVTWHTFFLSKPQKAWKAQASNFPPKKEPRNSQRSHHIMIHPSHPPEQSAPVEKNIPQLFYHQGTKIDGHESHYVCLAYLVQSPRPLRQAVPVRTTYHPSSGDRENRSSLARFG